MIEETRRLEQLRQDEEDENQTEGIDDSSSEVVQNLAVTEP